MTYTQTSILDLIEQGRQNAQDGLQRAVDHAERETPGWSETVWTIFVQWLSVKPRGYQFQVEDFRGECPDLPDPPSRRAYGGLTLRASGKIGLIRKVGLEPVNNPTAHRANAAVWEKV